MIGVSGLGATTVDSAAGYAEPVRQRDDVVGIRVECDDHSGQVVWRGPDGLPYKPVLFDLAPILLEWTSADLHAQARKRL